MQELEEVKKEEGKDSEEKKEELLGKENGLDHFNPEIGAVEIMQTNEPLIVGEKKKRRYCRKFPTAYVILLSFEILVFFLTFMV